MSSMYEKVGQISELSPSVTGEGRTLYEKVTITSLSSSNFICVAKIVAPVQGLYNVTLQTQSASSSRTTEVYLYRTQITTGAIGQIFANAVVGSNVVSTDATSSRMATITNPPDTVVTTTIPMYCRAGEFILVLANTSSSYPGRINNIVITYQSEVE